MKTKTHSERALEAAMTAFGSSNERAAAVCVFIEASRHLARVVGSKDAAELAYMMADGQAASVE